MDDLAKNSSGYLSNIYRLLSKDWFLLLSVAQQFFFPKGHLGIKLLQKILPCDSLKTCFSLSFRLQPCECALLAAEAGAALDSAVVSA